MNNKPVAQRAVEIWDNIGVVCWQKLIPGRRPKCASFLIVAEAVKDKLVSAKLHFFIFVSGIVEPYLKKIPKTRTTCPVYAGRLTFSSETSTFVDCEGQSLDANNNTRKCRKARSS